jgi:NADPH:quinone reductase-like Zn-dependent oxidoreductase
LRRAIFCRRPKPPKLSHIEAASIPIGALTAWQGLFDHADLQCGERVLVHGGAGAVGVFAIQLAKLQRAHVVATATPGNLDFVSSPGADEVIGYNDERFERSTRKVDVVFHTVGGETLDRSWGILKPRGRLVTIVSTAANSTDERVKKAFFIVEPNQKQLSKLAELVEAGSIRPVVDVVVPLSQAPDAYAGHVERRGQGKVVVAVGRDVNWLSALAQEHR